MRQRRFKESTFQSNIKSCLEALGALVFNVHGHGMQAAGWPDLQVYHPSWTGHLELKVGDNRLTTLQKLRIHDLVERGTPAYVLRWVEGDVVVESEVGLVLGKVTASHWKGSQGNNRGNLLFDLLHVVETETANSTRFIHPNQQDLHS